MPLYTYRREDGTTFDIRQSFSDSALTQDPVTGQKVIRLVQNPGVIFKGSGFYVNDSKGASKSSTVGSNKEAKDGDTAKPSADSKTAEPVKSETAKSEPAPASSSISSSSAAAD